MDRPSAVWRRILERDFAEREIFRLLTLMGNRITPGTVAAEAARVFGTEEKEEADDAGNKPEVPLLVENLSALPQTTRIDGVLPLHIPLAVDVARVAEELIDEAALIGLPGPAAADYAGLCEEISICYLGWLHNRSMQLDFGMMMEVRAVCPQSLVSGRKEELMLMGFLPNGSRITVFCSGLRAMDWLEMSAGALEYVDALEAVRDKGRLRLRTRRSGNQRPGSE